MNIGFFFNIRQTSRSEEYFFLSKYSLLSKVWGHMMKSLPNQQFLSHIGKNKGNESLFSSQISFRYNLPQIQNSTLRFET